MNKNLDKIEYSELYIKFLFIIISILSMSSIVYDKIGIFYKIFTVLNILILIIVFFKNYEDNIWDKKYIFLLVYLLISQFISTIVNYQNNLIGNTIEIAFMFSYCFISVIFSKKIQEYLLKYVSYIVQYISFLTAIFTLTLIIIRKSFFLTIDKNLTYFYGVLNGRVWGVINPNAMAIFSYISVVTAILIINKYRNKRHIFLKFNIVLQIIHFSIQQSRGAILSVLFMVIIYCLFVGYETKLYRRLLKTFIYLIFTICLIFSTNFITNVYVNSSKNEIIYLDKNLKSYTPEKKFILGDKDDDKINVRLSETKSSGRFEIWKSAVKMASYKPIFGYGIRNVRNYYRNFFSDYVINNSLKGGSFHNIFITVLVSGGIFNLIPFILIILYLSYRFLVYLLKGKSIYTKLVIMLFFGIALGQLFESIILYSTNFINICFWFISGYALYLINLEKEQLEYDKKNEIVSIKEIQDIEVEILDYVKSVCDKLKLNYFLAYGTLIGAIRHKGFIPWDDDVDLCMLREEYEKLQTYLINNPDDRFKVMSYKNNKNYVYSFMKISDSKTHLIEEDVYTDSNMGIYIDIFPIDGYDSNENIKHDIINTIKKRQLSCYTFKGIYNDKSLINTIIRNICLIIFSFCNANKYAEKIETLSKSRKIKDCEYCDYVGLKEMKEPYIRKEWFEKTVDVEFCGKFYKAPFEYDKILRADYGNYMELPPIEKRISHHSFKVWRI